MIRYSQSDAELDREARKEYDSIDTPVRRGGEKGRSFWNAYSYQFMFAPTFQFQPIPGWEKYSYLLVDETGKEYAFEGTSAEEPLTPVWKDIPEGVVTLTVTAISPDGEKKYPVGARTFYKLAPFTAALRGREGSYKEAADRALHFALQDPILRYWLTDGKPWPDYDHYVYPSKMISAILSSLLPFAKGGDEDSKEALEICVKSADYLLGITYQEGAAAGLPPTYYIDYRDHPETRDNLTGAERKDLIMMIYPATVGKAYLSLYSVTQDRKYYDAAVTIGRYYQTHVLPNGSWYLSTDIHTGAPSSPAYCSPLESIVPFLMRLCKYTGDESYRTLADNAVRYVEENMLSKDHWEGQFEDSFDSVHYSNLTHYAATALIDHYVSFYAEDPEKIRIAEELMHFVEDQFVVWKKPAPWNRHLSGAFKATEDWHTPAGLEQYFWHVPIDASTANIAGAFLKLYRLTGKELYLAKAETLADQIVKMQLPSGKIPTHWMDDNYRKNCDNFWLNCMFSSMKLLLKMAEVCD